MTDKQDLATSYRVQACTYQVPMQGVRKFTHDYWIFFTQKTMKQKVESSLCSIRHHNVKLRSVGGKSRFVIIPVKFQHPFLEIRKPILQ